MKSSLAEASRVASSTIGCGHAAAQRVAYFEMTMNPRRSAWLSISSMGIARR